MDNARLKEFLNKLPVGLLVGLYVLYLGYEYWSFTNDGASELVSRQAEVSRLEGEVKQLQGKLKQGQEFFRSLDAKKIQLRELAQKLDAAKGTLTNEVDVGAFVKLTTTEAKKVGLTVLGIRPDATEKKEFYEEQKFLMAFRGVYVQLLVFLDRLANLQNIVRADNFSLKPRGSQSAEYVELDGTIELKVYRYLPSKADEIGRGEPGGSAPAAAGSAPAQSNQDGGGQ